MNMTQEFKQTQNTTIFYQETISLKALRLALIFNLLEEAQAVRRLRYRSEIMDQSQPIFTVLL